MTRIIIAALLLAACDRDAMPNAAPDKCEEFTWSTERNGNPVNCRILWCEHGSAQYKIGGPAALWCDEHAVDVAPSKLVAAQP